MQHLNADKAGGLSCAIGHMYVTHAQSKAGHQYALCTLRSLWLRWALYLLVWIQYAQAETGEGSFISSLDWIGQAVDCIHVTHLSSP